MQMLPSAIITAFKSADRIHYNPASGHADIDRSRLFKMGKGLICDRLVIQFPEIAFR